MGSRDAIETPSAALEALPEPYNFASQTMLQVRYFIIPRSNKSSPASDLRVRRHRRRVDSAGTTANLFGSDRGSDECEDHTRRRPDVELLRSREITK